MTSNPGFYIHTYTLMEKACYIFQKEKYNIFLLENREDNLLGVKEASITELT